MSDCPTNLPAGRWTKIPHHCLVESGGQLPELDMHPDDGDDLDGYNVTFPYKGPNPNQRHWPFRKAHK